MLDAFRREYPFIALEYADQNSTELYNKFDTESLTILQKNHGMAINEVDKAQFRGRMQPVFDRFQERVGRELIETVRRLGS